MVLVPFGGPFWGPLGVRDRGPDRPWFQVVSGAAVGRCLDLLFRYLGMSFVHDFEKVLVFVRCGDSILTPDFLLP